MIGLYNFENSYFSTLGVSMTLGMGYYFDDSKTRTNEATTILYKPTFNVPGYDYICSDYMKQTLTSFDNFFSIL